MYYSTDYESPIGKMLIVSDGECLLGIWFYNQKHFMSSIRGDVIEDDELPIFERVIKWLDDYFDGLNPRIDFVWRILSDIPYGETMTYGEIASMISPTMSAQAVGGAVGANPIAIVIPCHRGLGKNGKLTGYAAGLERKIELLKIENILK